MLAIYTLTIFVSAGLLFLVQPLFARMVLPLLGGSPAVWNTALVFYQAALLAGYAYAHALTTKLGARRAALAHLVVIAIPLLFLPIAIPPGWVPPQNANPSGWLLMLLLACVGLPFFAVSTSSPTLQKWFAATGHPAAADPYFLYAASNAGSMIALLSYPFWIEPRLRLIEQSRLWQAGYALFFALMIVCAWALWRSPEEKVRPNSGVLCAPIPLLRRARWVVLALVPSSLMIGVTTYLSNEIAAIPLLWIVPLVLYLLSFICVFATHPPIPHALAVRALAILIIPLAVALTVRATDPMTLLVPLHLGVLFLAALVCHGEIARDRPAPEHLTGFYLAMSVGGVLGGAFNALLAPQIWTSVSEYPLMLVLAGALLPRAFLLDNAKTGTAENDVRRDSQRDRILDFALPILVGLATAALMLGLQRAKIYGPAALALMFGPTTLACFSFSRRPLRFALALGAILLCGGLFHVENEGDALLTERSFFGVHRVTRDGKGRYIILIHGNTVHGQQSVDPARRREPLSYYYPSGPIGQAFEKMGAAWNSVGVVGLGVGSLAAYAEPHQQWTYFEIDPAVERIARDKRFFSFISDSRAPLSVSLGDARLSLQSVPDVSLDVLILDAYSSDAIPIHLMTREAVGIYLRKLKPNGILSFHISNRHLDLEPVVAALMDDARLKCLVQRDLKISRRDADLGKLGSIWVMAARTGEDLKILDKDARWKPLRRKPDSRVWTDDYSSILAAMKWK